MKDLSNACNLLFLVVISFTITKITAQDTTAVNSTSYKKKQDEDCESPFRAAKTLKEGSVLDVLKSPGEMPLR